MENPDQSAQQNKLTQIYFWGSDNSGLLGPDKKPKTLYLKPQSFNFGVKIDYLACGDEHIIFLSNGYCYSMGENIDGRLGIPKNIKATSAPLLIETLLKFYVVKVACGSKHSVAMADSGQAFVWGCGTSGQLGLGNQENQGSPQQVILENNYQRSRGEASEAVIDISCGSEHTAVITKYGDVYTFGSNEFGQLGIGNNKTQFLPARVNTPNQNVHKVSCGRHHTLILTAQGHIYGFGLNSSGQLGIGNTQSSSIPTKTLIPENVKITKITAGYHSLALSTKGELFIWGESSLGRFVKPNKYAWTSNLEITSAEMGHDFTVGVDDKGYVWGFGNNSSGELGQGNLESYDSVIPISYLNSIEIKSVSCGKSFVVALADYSTDSLSANEVRQIENRQSYEYRSKTDQDMEYFESSREEDQIIESQTESLSERAPSPLRTNPDFSGKGSRNFVNVSGQKTSPMRTRNQISHSKEEWQESETNLETETDRFRGESPAFSIQNHLIETKYMKETGKNVLAKDQMRNILVDMKILKLQNTLLEQQLEERSRQIAGLQSKLKDTIHKTKKSTQNEQKMKELVLTVEAQSYRFREENVKNSEELKVKESEIEKLMRAINEKDLYIESLEKRNDSSKELIQDLLQINKLATCLLPNNQEIDPTFKSKLLSQLENLNIPIPHADIYKTDIAETQRSEVLIDLYKKHRFSLDQQLKPSPASPKTFSMTSKTQKSPHKSPQKSSSISKNENYLQSFFQNRKKEGAESKNSLSHDKELSVHTETLTHTKLPVAPQASTPVNKESRTSDIYSKSQSQFNLAGLLPSKAMERGLTEPDQKTLTSAKSNKANNEFIHQKKFSEPAIDSKALSNYANDGKSHRTIINNYFKGLQNTQEKGINVPKDLRGSPPAYTSNQSNLSPKVPSKISSTPAYAPLTVREAAKDRKKSQPSQFYTKLVGMISSPPKTTSTIEKTRISLDKNTARQVYYK